MFKSVKTNVEMYREYKKMIAEREAFILERASTDASNGKRRADYVIVGMHTLDIIKMKSCMEELRCKSIVMRLVIRFLEAIGRV